MTSSRSNHSLDNLKRLYAYRKQIAEAKVEEQKAVIRKSRQELIEREERVAKLDSEIQENVDFLSLSDKELSTEMLHSANRHRYWTDYDKQKENYYVDLTRQELNEYLEELKHRRVFLTKLEAKTEVVDSLRRKNNAVLDRRLATESEDEFATNFNTRAGGANV